MNKQMINWVLAAFVAACVIGLLSAFTNALAATTVTHGTWDLYRSSTIVARGFAAEADCVAAANQQPARTYTCRTTTTVVVMADPVPSPPPPPVPSPGSGCSATFSWIPPLTNTDNSALTNLAGYRAYWGTTQGVYPNSATINNPGATSYVVSPLVDGTWYFVVTAFNTANAESADSDPASKVISGCPPSTSQIVSFTQLGSNGMNSLTFAGTATVTLTLPAGLAFDWVRQDSATGALVSTTPNLGSADNDGLSSQSITLQGPFANLYVDVDGAALGSAATQKPGDPPIGAK